MASSSISLRRLTLAVLGAALLVGLMPAGAASEPLAVSSPTIEGPIPGSPPGDRLSPVLEDTYPFFSTWQDLAAAGFVEQEFYISGNADAYSTTGALVAPDVPYKSRLIVRRPVDPAKFNGTVLVEQSARRRASTRWAASTSTPSSRSVRLNPPAE